MPPPTLKLFETSQNESKSVELVWPIILWNGSEKPQKTLFNFREIDVDLTSDLSAQCHLSLVFSLISSIHVWQYNVLPT